MHIHTKSLQNGFTLPVLGLGTWQMGGKLFHDAENDEASDIQAIQQTIQAGVTHIDTAEAYAAGYTETLVGQAIKNVGRTKLFLTSKVAPEHYYYDDLIHSCKESLKRLGTDYLDLYLLHRPILNVPVTEVMQALDDLKKEGLIRHIGVSNFSVERFQEAQAVTENKIVVNQVHYNLLFREPQRKGVVAFCQENDVMLVAYRPLQLGLLAQKESTLMQELSKKYNKTLPQISLQWLMAQKNVVTITKMGNEKHREEDVASCNFALEQEDIIRLDQEFPNQQDISDVVPLL